MPPGRLTGTNSALLVIDVQERLLAAIPPAPVLLLNLTFLLDVARQLDVPVLATEQYPKGLGPTAAALTSRLPSDRPAKRAFSCAAVPEVTARLRDWGRPAVLLTGMETHVCVQQTALDLLGQGYEVFLPVDAVAGRFALDHDTALHRLERAGAVLTTAEAAAFEWLETSEAPAFKAVSALVQERARRLRELTSPEAAQ